MGKENTSSGLRSLRLWPLPLGSVKPGGWLRDQLRAQAEGLSGHLDEFWPDVARSAWIGGDGEGWERGPYWLDGIVPLAFLLDDERLGAKVRRWVDSILASQAADGWLGPQRDTKYGYEYDPWPRFVVLKALIQYHGATDDPRIPVAIERFLHCLDGLLGARPLRSWARYRWADLLLAIYWLYDREEREWLLRLARKVHAQGFEWRRHFERFLQREKSRKEECDLSTHGVNNAMAIKAPAVWSRLSGKIADLRGARLIMKVLDRYHGQANGTFSCDEHLAGTSPSQGTELCAVVEYMYSIEEALAITGDPLLADRLEELAFNALPATMSGDMWSHQYVQQVNQAACSVHHDHLWTSNGPEANIFGLAPEFGCCTANLTQGWPKFASHLWMRNSHGGISVVAYAPSSLDAAIDSLPVRIRVETGYPFGNVVKLVVDAARPVSFPLELRIPGWADGTEVGIHGESARAEAGTFFRMDREWRGRAEVTISFPDRVRAVRRPGQGIAVYDGPLLFALPLKETWKQLRGELPHADWEVLTESAWNYALQTKPGRSNLRLRREQTDVTTSPFVTGIAPVCLEASGSRLPEWREEHGGAGAPPTGAALNAPAVEPLTLVPYGCTHLRIAEFPFLAE